MESSSRQSNSLVQVTNPEPYNLMPTLFTPKIEAYISFGNYSAHISAIKTPTLVVTEKGSVLTELSGKFHLRNGTSTNDLHDTIKAYD